MSDVVDDAGKWYREAKDCLMDQRRQIEEDLKFSDPSDPQQWDEAERMQRERDPGGARPCLTMDQTSQYTATVVGQIEQSPPSLHSLPAAAGADQKVAERLDGLYRNIEYTSRASQHYMRALLSAARTGVGYIVVRPEYTDRALNHQEPRISSEGDPLRVVFDPWSVEIDGSDADRGIILSSFSHLSFERQFGAKAEKISFGDEGYTYVDERESILVAEEWRKEKVTETMFVVQSDDGDEYSLSEDDYEKVKGRPRAPKKLREYEEKTTSVRWLRMSGSEVLTPETVYPADGIGIVPVYGYTSWIDGRIRYCGIARRARDPQRAYNFHVSEIRARMATAPKSPWIVPTRAIRGFEAIWDRASVESRSYLPVHDQDQNGAIAMPQRTPVDINLQTHMAGAQQALHDIQAALGMYQASLGAPSNETSGLAIDARKQQGEAATSHFPANLSSTVTQVGMLCMQMLPRLIDTKRQMRILGVDGTPSNITMDPKQAEAVKETDGGLSINPNIGRYDVRVVVGSPYSTQRQQAQEAFTEMMRANPSLTPAIAPLWAQTLDIPNADKLSQVLIAMAPDPVKAVLQPDGGNQPNTAQLQTQVKQLQAQLQQAVQLAHQAQADADQAHQSLESKQVDQQDSGTKLAIDAYNAETNRLKVIGPSMGPNEVQALIRQELQQLLANPSPWPGEPQQPAAEVQSPPMDTPTGVPIPQGPHQLGTPPIVGSMPAIPAEPPQMPPGAVPQQPPAAPPGAGAPL